MAQSSIIEDLGHFDLDQIVSSDFVGSIAISTKMCTTANFH